MENSWEQEYVDSGAEALFMKRFDPSSGDKVYAHYAAIVQASGMDKSRTSG